VKWLHDAGIEALGLRSSTSTSRFFKQHSYCSMGVARVFAAGVDSIVFTSKLWWSS